MNGLSHTRHRQTPYHEINSPLPRLGRYIDTAPLPGSGHFAARQGAFSDCQTFVILKFGDFGVKDKAKTLLEKVCL